MKPHMKPHMEPHMHPQDTPPPFLASWADIRAAVALMWQRDEVFFATMAHLLEDIGRRQPDSVVFDPDPALTDDDRPHTWEELRELTAAAYPGDHIRRLGDGRVVLASWDLVSEPVVVARPAQLEVEVRIVGIGRIENRWIYEEDEDGKDTTKMRSYRAARVAITCEYAAACGVVLDPAGWSQPAEWLESEIFDLIMRLPRDQRRPLMRALEDAVLEADNGQPFAARLTLTIPSGSL